MHDKHIDTIQSYELIIVVIKTKNICEKFSLKKSINLYYLYLYTYHI